MLTLEDKARAVIISAWSKLPRKHTSAAIAKISIADLGVHNGEYNCLSLGIRLNYRLFDCLTVDDVPMIDDYGNFNPRSSRMASRALHTVIHEMAHAIGEKTHLDRNPEWLSISGWYETNQPMPMQYGRYIETRPGWDQEASSWTFRKDAWFFREYSSKSPYEDFADCVAIKALGWESRFGFKHGLKKLHYIERLVFGQRGLTKPLSELYDRVYATTMKVAKAKIKEPRWTLHGNLSGKA